MNIHFVCVGNTFRSRLAEAYLNSRHIDNIKATSSGIEADLNLNGAITWYAQWILFKEKQIPYTSITWQKTTPELINTCDYVIFLGKDIYESYKNKYNEPNTKYEIWEIPDAPNFGVSGYERGIKELIAMSKIEKIYNMLKHDINHFIHSRLKTLTAIQ